MKLKQYNSKNRNNKKNQKNKQTFKSKNLGIKLNPGFQKWLH